jgi:hypothetical protein
MNDPDFSPTEPFEAHRKRSLASAGGNTDDEKPPDILIVAYNTTAIHSVWSRLIHSLRKWKLTEERCPDCDQAVEVDTWMWRQSDAALTCEVCAEAKSGTLIAADTKERVTFRNGKVEVPERITRLRGEIRQRKHERLKSSISHLDELIESNPEEPWLYVHRGNLRRSLCEFEDVAYCRSLVWLRDFGRAVELAPNHVWIRCWRAIEFFGRQKNGDQVIADLEQALAIDPGYESAREFLDKHREYIDRFGAKGA